MSSPFCSYAVEQLKKGPENIPKIIKNGTGYVDDVFNIENMVWWENDDLTTPAYSTMKTYIN